MSSHAHTGPSTDRSHTVRSGRGGPIVVGVDGSEAATVALRWAAAEAIRRQLPIHVVAASYVDPFSDPGGGELVPVVVEAAKEHAQQALEEAEAVAGAQGSVVVTAASTYARPVDALVGAAEDAEMIVVGGSGQGSGRWPRIGSVALGLLPVATVPVVVVPREVRGTPDGPVVVGVAGWRSDEQVLAHAFEEASFRGVVLRAVHAWGDRSLHVASARSTDKVPDLADAAWHSEMRVLSESLAGWRDRYPDVRVETMIPHDDPADAVLHTAAGAGLIVIGSRRHGTALALLLGSTCRGVIPHANVPVMVVPRRP